MRQSSSDTLALSGGAGIRSNLSACFRQVFYPVITADEHVDGAESVIETLAEHKISAAFFLTGKALDASKMRETGHGRPWKRATMWGPTPMDTYSMLLGKIARNHWSPGNDSKRIYIAI